MCCKGFLKCMMFIFNGTIFLAGGAILGVGVWMKVDGDSLLGLLPHNSNSEQIDMSQLMYISYVLMGLGSFLVLIGFLGCCGAVRESKCMLLTFFCIVLLIFLIEVAGGVVLIVFKDVAAEVFHKLEEDLVKQLRDDYGKNPDVTSIWNATMTELKCCGINNYTDFDRSSYQTIYGSYPPQCCQRSFGTCNPILQAQPVDGCLDKLVQLIKDNIVIIAGVALGIAALEIAAMVVSMILYCDINSKANDPYRG